MSEQEDLFTAMLGSERPPLERMPPRSHANADDGRMADALEVQKLVVEEMAADKAALEAEKAELESAKAGLEAENASLTAEKAALESERDGLQKRVGELEQEAARLAAENGELEEKLARMGRSLAAARRAAAGKVLESRH